MSGHSLSATLVHSTATKFSSVTAVADLKMLPFVEYSVFSESLFYFLQLRSTAREWLWVDDGVSEWVELKAQEHGKERFASWHDRAGRELIMDWLGCPLRQGSARLSTDQLAKLGRPFDIRWRPFEIPHLRCDSAKEDEE